VNRITGRTRVRRNGSPIEMKKLVTRLPALYKEKFV
jgi:hypothetical protein